MLDDAAMLLGGARHKARRLARAVDVQTAGQHHRLVGDDPDRRSLHPGKADQNVASEVGLYLEKVAVVDDLFDQLLHVVGLVWVARREYVERGLGAVARVGGGPQRRVYPARGRQKIDEPAQLDQ